jgi:RNA polymerase sigma-70 factor, ECF subfamily
MQNVALPIETPRDWTEAKLLQRVLAHDARAWGELVRRYRPIIFRCITKILARRGAFLATADIEEVYGEVMMSLVRDDMRKLRIYDPMRGAKLGSWIGLLAKNAAHDYIRAHASKPVADTMDRVAELNDDGASPLDDILVMERRSRLEGMLAEYSQKDREFFSLYFGRGLTVDEIALEMGISVKTVYTKKHKLLTRLATTMAPM